MTQHTPITGTSVDSNPITCYNDPMNNRTMHLSLAELAQMSDDAWVWKDDMITFCEADDDDLEYELSWYDDGSAERLIDELAAETHGMIWGNNEDHPICGEFPHDSVIAPRGWDKVD